MQIIIKLRQQNQRPTKRQWKMAERQNNRYYDNLINKTVSITGENVLVYQEASIHPFEQVKYDDVIDMGQKNYFPVTFLSVGGSFGVGNGGQIWSYMQISNQSELALISFFRRHTRKRTH